MKKIIGSILLGLVLNCSTSTPKLPPPTSQSLQSCKSDLMQIPWVKDVFLSSGYMNIGVISYANDWNSPLFGMKVNSVLKTHGINATFIRFVDIQEVVYKNKSPREAEIVVFNTSAL